MGTGKDGLLVSGGNFGPEDGRCPAPRSTPTQPRGVCRELSWAPSPWLPSPSSGLDRLHEAWRRWPASLGREVSGTSGTQDFRPPQAFVALLYGSQRMRDRQLGEGYLGRETAGCQGRGRRANVWECCTIF